MLTARLALVGKPCTHERTALHHKKLRLLPPPSLATVRCVRYVSVPAGRGRAPLMPALLGRSLLLSRCGLRCQSRWADTRHSVHKERARASCMSVLRDKRGCGTVVQGPDTDRLTHTHKHTHTHTHIHTHTHTRTHTYTRIITHPRTHTHTHMHTYTHRHIHAHTRSTPPHVL